MLGRRPRPRAPGRDGACSDGGSLRPADGWSFCHSILPAVSRSFALIIPECPPPIDRGLCVGYLLCRMADTIEDDAKLDDRQRAELYDRLLAAVDAPSDPCRAEAFLDAWPLVPQDDYGRLIEGVDLVLSAYSSLPAEAASAIRTCVHEMVAGMRTIRPVETRGGVAFMCRNLDDLDRYCHYVAGTVGIMSTALFETRFSPAEFTPTGSWREDGRRLGLGLQMTNIIKDCRVDAARGVSFIPAGLVDVSGGAYRLRSTGRRKVFERAIGHLDAALGYILAIPAGESGIRTFLLGSLFPAIATLEVAASGTEVHPKIDRSTMADILAYVRRHAGDDGALRAWYLEHRRGVVVGGRRPASVPPSQGQAG